MRLVVVVALFFAAAAVAVPFVSFAAASVGGADHQLFAQRKAAAHGGAAGLANEALLEQVRRAWASGLLRDRGFRGRDDMVATLSAEPPSVPGSFSPVMVKWNQVPNPQFGDVLSITVGGRVVGATAVSDASPTSWAQGWGSFTIMLPNFRGQEVVVGYSSLAADGNWTTLGDVSIGVDEPAYPAGVRLAFTGRAGEMRVAWTSGSSAPGDVQFGGCSEATRQPRQQQQEEEEALVPGATAAASSATAAAKWAVSAKDRRVAHEVPGGPTSYGLADMCTNTSGGQNARHYFIDPGYFHAAIMAGLTPGQEVCYSVGNKNAAGHAIWSPTYRFVMPAVGSAAGTTHNKPTKLLIWGDSGTGDCAGFTGWCEPPSVPMTSWLEAEQQRGGVDAAVHIGDVAYAVGYASRWEQFLNQMEPVSSTVAYMTTNGNHESDYIGQSFSPWWGTYGADSQGECGIPYGHRFVMPGTELPVRGPGGNDGRQYWSVEVGNVHLTMLSSEVSFLPNSTQHSWLARDLASVDRTRTPWVVTGMHRPLYESCDYAPGREIRAEIEMRMALEPLFRKHRVDLNIAGHMHNAERTCKMAEAGACAEYISGGKPIPNNGDGGTTYYVAGMGGMGLFDFPAWQPAWSRFRLAAFGYTKLEATRTELSFSLILNNGTLADSFTLNR